MPTYVRGDLAHHQQNPPPKSRMHKRATSALEKDASKKLKWDEENKDEEQSGKGKVVKGK